MKLDLSPRASLIARMQAWAYENIKQGNYPRAEKEARLMLLRFDTMLEEHPTDNAGYWSGYYFEEFKHACADM